MTVELFSEEYRRDDGVTVIERRAFCADYFHYEPGEHVVFGGPTTRGKSTLAFDLCEFIISPDFPLYVAVSKPRDKVTAQAITRLNLRKVPDWPPEKRLRDVLNKNNRPSGYVVWPPFGDLNRDMQRCAEVTEKLLMERYAAGVNPKNRGGILFMDDTMIKAKIMKLDQPMSTILAMAGAMGLGEWVSVQKPTDAGRTPLLAYEQATHIFLTKGGDEQMLKRYGEIANENGPLVRRVVPTLGDFQFLYIHKHSGYLCIVDAK